MDFLKPNPVVLVLSQFVSLGYPAGQTSGRMLESWALPASGFLLFVTESSKQMRRVKHFGF